MKSFYFSVFLAAALGASVSAGAHSVKWGGSDFGDLGELVHPPECEFADPGAAGCTCLEREKGCRGPKCECLTWEICPCDPGDPILEEKDLKCVCRDPGEEPEKMSEEQVRDLITDRMGQLLDGRKIGDIEVEDKVIRVMIVEPSGAPFYEVVIDREKGRQVRPLKHGEGTQDPRSRTGKLYEGY